jgi:hypothetical protein
MASQRDEIQRNPVEMTWCSNERIATLGFETMIEWMKSIGFQSAAKHSERRFADTSYSVDLIMV